MNKGLFYFIVFDLFLAVLLIFNFNFKNHNDGQGLFASFSAWVDSQTTPIAKPTDSQNTQTTLSNKDVNMANPVPKLSPTQTNQDLNKANSSVNVNALATNNSSPIGTSADKNADNLNNTNNNSNGNGVCISYGPLNLEQKVALDLILNSNKINHQFYTENKFPLFSVYWNLGKDKLQAIDLFEKQKNEGALQDEKFKLTQSLEGEWIVPITTISGNADLAQKMTHELAKSSKSFGGKWEYKAQSEGYFYRFKDITSLPNKTVETINHSINTLKTPC